MNDEQLHIMAHGKGFIAALDQSGGSTPKALKAYGVDESAYGNDQQMFDLVHAMRSRIVTDPAFDGHRVLAAILFEDTMDRRIEGQDSADYLWHARHVVPILKVDQGLAPQADGVQLMKPMPGLDALLAQARAKGIFGTKMRSVVHGADRRGIEQVVEQQFAFGSRILAAGFMPILEPEVNIEAPDKAQAEALLKTSLQEHLDSLPEASQVMLKLSLPSIPGLYADFAQHPRVLRVAALSGGYSRDEAVHLLAQNKGMIASFSRALTEGLSVQQSNVEFHRQLDRSIQSIYQASIA